jgi:hypothetical protein
VVVAVEVISMALMEEVVREKNHIMHMGVIRMEVVFRRILPIHQREVKGMEDIKMTLIRVTISKVVITMGTMEVILEDTVIRPGTVSTMEEEGGEDITVEEEEVITMAERV